MKAPKSAKSFLTQLKLLGEETLISELKGINKLTDKEKSYLRGIIAGIQNELGEMDENIWRQYNIEPYQGYV